MGTAYALIFPGQASQHVGMGQEFCRLSPTAAEIFAEADRRTGLALQAAMANGPLELLTTTRYAQPAVVATSLVALHLLRQRLVEARLPAPSFCAGHSVGEISALVAAGALDTLTALQLVAERARLMAAACEGVDGTMAAVLGLPEPPLAELCRQATDATGHTVQIANLNAPDQIVVSGHREAVAWLRQEAPRQGARRVVPLNVGGPFHSVYMRPAAEAFARVLDAVDLRAPNVPVVLNQTGRPTTDAQEIRRELAEQIAAPVRWSDSLQAMAAAGCGLFVEVGPGQVLAGLVRRTLPAAKAISVHNPETLEQAVVLLAEAGA